MMDLFNSGLGQIGVVLLLFGAIWGFFRKLLVPIIVFVVAEIALFVLMPGLLLTFVNLVNAVRGAVS